MNHLDQKWEYIVSAYRRLMTNSSRRIGLTDRQMQFDRMVRNKCFGRVYMSRPTNYMVNKLYDMAKEIPT